ncbi:MAG: serine protein kinase RIO [Candidatus Micrarchaeia archaeon]
MQKEKMRLKERKVIESEVFDRSVLRTLAQLMDKKIIKKLEFPIAKGKEAYVFRAEGGENTEDPYLAVKIYMIETSDFKRMQDYIRGDPRFRRVKHNKRDVVYAWTKKEFRNLKSCEEAGVHVPAPYYFQNNVLVMKFIGDENGPAPLLKDVDPPDPKRNFREVITDMKRMYRVGLVHADISEYNILVWEDCLFIIDLGQGVSLEHPMADHFLERDVDNLIRYFSKYQIIADREKLIKEIKGVK